MPASLLKCPKCGKRGAVYASVRAIKALRKGKKWTISCRYCRLKKDITHPELLELWDADPVFMKRYMERFNKPEFREKFEGAVAGVVRAMREKKKE